MDRIFHSLVGTAGGGVQPDRADRKAAIGLIKGKWVSGTKGGKVVGVWRRGYYFGETLRSKE